MPQLPNIRHLSHGLRRISDIELFGERVQVPDGLVKKELQYGRSQAPDVRLDRGVLEIVRERRGHCGRIATAAAAAAAGEEFLRRALLAELGVGDVRESAGALQLGKNKDEVGMYSVSRVEKGTYPNIVRSASLIKTNKNPNGV